jgi:hypothetical protein
MAKSNHLKLIQFSFALHLQDLYSNFALLLWLLSECKARYGAAAAASARRS